MARPKLDIDPDMVEKLAGVGCTDKEVASILECSVDTLSRRFAEFLEKGRSNRKMSLRRKQTEVAMGGNVSMLIWLGKQDLDQKDRVEIPPESDFLIKLKDLGKTGPIKRDK